LFSGNTVQTLQYRNFTYFFNFVILIHQNIF
jgi:hypothetical protein